MDEVARSAQIVRFGVFEADLQTGELRKNGLRVPLQGQPFQVFAILLEHSGVLVTREELRHNVWPEDTFVDFDHALNTAITKIRLALGDEADNPRFVETLPRRGYRFIGPVESKTGGRGGIAVLSIGSIVPPEPTPVPQPIPPERSAGTVTGHGHWKSMAAAGVAVVVLAVGGYFYFHRVSKLTDRDTIVLADFVNTTGDSVFDDTLKQGLRVQLEQSPFLNVLSDQQVNDELRLMGRSSEQPFTSEVARDLCQRLGRKAVLAGSIASLGNHYAIGINAFDCHTGDGLASEQGEANSPMTWASVSPTIRW
jgi:DNA-binding winged helix-turn-helix (wHTH) protein